MATLTLDRFLSTSTSSSSSSKRPFTDRLPPELRYDIFKLCFPSNTTIHLSFDPWGSLTSDNLNGTKDALSLARTCNKIHTEVIGLFYGSNMFSFTTSSQMYRFTVKIGKGGRQVIQGLEFSYDHNRPEHLAILTGCRNLQRLHIGLEHWNIERLRRDNIKDKTNIGVWEWERQGTYIWEVLYRLPHHGLDLKIREVTTLYYGEHMSSFFEGPIKPLYIGFTSDGLVEKYEAEVKEYLRRLPVREAKAASWLDPTDRR